MKVTYINHSGFMIELDHTVLLFDYYKGDIPQVDEAKELYIFASHNHPDHFNPAILQIIKDHPCTHYFLSKDVRIRDSYLEKHQIEKDIMNSITFLPRNTSITWNENSPTQMIQIETLTSTDEGVAFSVSCEGYMIYHAGDLNWWHWNGESKAYNRNMEVNYKREIDKLKGNRYDVAFVPLDDRLEAAYGYGLRYFMENVHADNLFPMHLWEHFEAINRFKIENKDLDCSGIMDIDRDGMIWNI